MERWAEVELLEAEVSVHYEDGVTGRRYAGSMTQGARTERVGEEFREILAEEIQKLKDPRVGFVTVTGVRVSPDLRHAWVSYTALGDDKAQGRAAARRSGRRPRTCAAALGRQVRLKFLPELEFEEDQTLRAGPADRRAHRRSSTGRSEPNERRRPRTRRPRCWPGPPRWRSRAT